MYGKCKYLMKFENLITQELENIKYNNVKYLEILEIFSCIQSKKTFNEDNVFVLKTFLLKKC